MQRLLRLAAALVPLLLLAAPGGPASAQSELPEASRQCPLFEAAYRAVEPGLAAAGARPQGRRFSYRVFDAPHDRAAAGTRPAPGPDLRACPDLQQMVLAGGAAIVGSRPVLGVRAIGGPAYDHFSRPVQHDGRTYLTYYIGGKDQGVDITLRREAGGWVVERADAWETIVLN